MVLLTVIMNFINKFFGFFKVENGEMHEYNDKLGYGTFEDARHIWWIAIVIILSIFMYQYCKKNREKGKKLVKSIVIFVLSIRIVLQIIKSIIGNSLPHGRDLIPGQMCTILIYLLPLMIIFDWKKIRTPVCVLSMMGAVMTILINDYFNSRFMSFYTIEGIWAHTVLLVIPIAMIGLGEFKLELKKVWQVIVTILIMLVWAVFLNKIVFKDYAPNYFYLEKNMLPGNLGGDYFILIYAIIFFALLGIIYLLPVIIRKVSKLLTKGNEKLKNKIIVIIVASILIIAEILTIGVGTNRKTKVNEEEEKVNLAILLSMIENKSINFKEEQIQERLDSIVGEDKVEVKKELIGLRVIFKETGNVYNTINAKSNLKAVVIKQKINEILKYILEAILVINLIITIVLICKNRKGDLLKKKNKNLINEKT